MEVKIQVGHFHRQVCAVLLGYWWCHICHKTWSQWLLSVSPLNLTVEVQGGVGGGFKRELMNWPFPFHLFLISIRTQLTFSATYQASGPRPLHTLSPTQREHSSSKLVLSPICASVCTDFFHLTHSDGRGRAAQTNHDIPFSLGN